VSDNKEWGGLPTLRIFEQFLVFASITFIFGLPKAMADLKTCNGVAAVPGQLVCENFETVSLGNLFGRFESPSTSSQSFKDLFSRGWSGVGGCIGSYCPGAIVNITGYSGQPTRALRFRYEEGPKSDSDGTGLEVKLEIECAFNPSSPLCGNGGAGKDIWVRYRMMTQPVPSNTASCAPNCPTFSTVNDSATKQHYLKSTGESGGPNHSSFSFVLDYFFNSTQMANAVQGDYTACNDPAGCTNNLYQNQSAVSTVDNHWYCVVYHMHMNTPGDSDGYWEMWMDNRKVAYYPNRKWDSSAKQSWMDYFMIYRQSGGYQWRYEDDVIIGNQPLSCDGSTPPPPVSPTPPAAPVGINVR
jgi:hypothetical protein